MALYRTRFAAATVLGLLGALALAGCGTFELNVEVNSSPGNPVPETPEPAATEAHSQVPDAVTPTPIPDGYVPLTPPPVFTPIPVADYAAPGGLRVAWGTGGEIRLWGFETRQAAVLAQQGQDTGQIKISDDGAIVAFLQDDELWAVNSDGTKERLLVKEQDLADGEVLGPGSAIHRLEWVPGTHLLAFNTRQRLPHGLVLNDDMHLVDADGLEHTRLLPPGEGGEFYYSPDGERIAVVTAGEITLVDDEGQQRNRVLTYTPINTASEFQYYARPVWASDGSALRVAIPPADLHAQPSGPTTIWHIPTDGLPARLLRSVDAALSMGYDTLAFSHDLKLVAYSQIRQSDGTPQGEPGIWVEVLRLANGDRQSYPYASNLFQWAPDVDRFTFTAGRQQPRLYVGQWSGPTLPGSVGEDTPAYDVRWVDGEHYLAVTRRGAVSGSQDEGWDLVLADVQGVSTVLASLSEFPQYDFAVAAPDTREPASPSVTATPVAGLPGLVYQMEDGLWMDTVRGKRWITDYPAAQLSPDGSHVVYQALENDAGDIGLAVLALDEEYNLTNTPDRIEKMPQWWSAKPGTVLCSSLPLGEQAEGGALGYLTAVNMDGSGYRVLDEVNPLGSPPAPAPDGQTIAYSSGREGWLYRWGSGSERFEPEDYGMDSAQGIELGNPAWSPDGQRLAWLFAGDIVADGRGQYGVVVFDLESRTSQVLRTSEEWAGLYWPPGPVWSPDGVWLAHVVWTDAVGEEGVWVVRADGRGDVAQHLGGGNPVWSPDGGWLAFTQSKGDRPRHWIVQPGSWARLAVELPPDAYLLAWLAP